MALNSSISATTVAPVFVGIGDHRHIVHRYTGASGRAVIVVPIGIIHRTVYIRYIQQIRHIAERGQLPLRGDLSAFIQLGAEIIGFGIVKAAVLKHIALLLQQPEQPLVLAVDRPDINRIILLHRQDGLIQQADIQRGLRPDIPADQHKRHNPQQHQRDKKIPPGLLRFFHLPHRIFGLLLCVARGIVADLLRCGGKFVAVFVLLFVHRLFSVILALIASIHPCMAATTAGSYMVPAWLSIYATTVSSGHASL